MIFFLTYKRIKQGSDSGSEKEYILSYVDLRE